MTTNLERSHHMGDKKSKKDKSKHKKQEDAKHAHDAQVKKDKQQHSTANQ